MRTSKRFELGVSIMMKLRACCCRKDEAHFPATELQRGGTANTTDAEMVIEVASRSPPV